MTIDWLNITPVSGGAGKINLAFSVNSDNTSTDVRQKQFRVKAPDGTTKAIITVTQEGRKRAFSGGFGKGFK